jgi:transposase-like protein
MSERRGRGLAARLGEPGGAGPIESARQAAPARYFDLVREMKDTYNHRLRLVESARQRWIKPTARLFATTVPTVRKWLRRYRAEGAAGLLKQSRTPLHQPRKTPPGPGLERQLIELRQLSLLSVPVGSSANSICRLATSSSISRAMGLRSAIWSCRPITEGSFAGFAAKLLDSQHVRIPPGRPHLQQRCRDRPSAGRRRVLRSGVAH